MKNVTLFILIASFWSGSFIAIQPLVQAMPPITAGAIRVGVAILFLSFVLPMRKLPLVVPRNVRTKVWITGLFAFGFPFSFLFWGEQSVSAGLAGIINGTIPLWVFLLGALLSGREELLSVRKYVGLTLGLLGILFIFLPKILSTGDQSSLWGTVAVVGMAICYAIGVLMNRSVFAKTPTLHPFTNLYQQLWAGFLFMAILAFLWEGLPHPENWRPLSTVIIAELYLGCVSTGLAFMIFYDLIKQWGSVRASTVAYVVPALTLLFDILFNQRVPGGLDIAGVVSITCGVVALSFPVKKIIRSK